ncbi:MAG: class I SAM-dependent methyltransferase [Desulfobaccales bacterium]
MDNTESGDSAIRVAAWAEPRVPWIQRLRWALGILRAYRVSNLENADGQIIFHQKLAAIIKATLEPDPNGLRLLEIGCGQRASQTILFTADGLTATGIDVEVPTFRMPLGRFLQVLRANGWERGLKSILRHWLFDGQFFRRLSCQYGQPLPLDRVDVRLMSATQMGFPDNYFSFIFSSLVFEHIDDVPAAVREVNRVLKPRGRACINVHLFPSLSGGHHPEWTDARRPPTHPRVPPWDHLQDNRYPAHSHLNRLRLTDYRKIFNSYLEVLEENQVMEMTGELSPGLETILVAKGYTREDLLTREVAFLCRKK